MMLGRFVLGFAAVANRGRSATNATNQARTAVHAVLAGPSHRMRSTRAEPVRERKFSPNSLT
jgi:hypothetical protein